MSIAREETTLSENYSVVPYKNIGCHPTRI
jgi:hypothetical protein